MMIDLDSVLLLISSMILVISGIGVVRFPDSLCRMHAAAKGPSFAIVLMLMAVGVFFNALEVWVKVVLAVALVFSTVPVSSQLLARVAMRERELQLSKATKLKDD